MDFALSVYPRVPLLQRKLVCFKATCTLAHMFLITYCMQIHVFIYSIHMHMKTYAIKSEQVRSAQYIAKHTYNTTYPKIIITLWLLKVNFFFLVFPHTSYKS